jgi:pyruvate dehydrogenase E1 component
MFRKKENCFYYLTTMNENYSQPEMPKGVEDGIVKGFYPLVKSSKSKKNSVAKVTLMGAGTILKEVIAASSILSDKYSVDSDIWSLTSVNELVRNGQEVDRWNLLHPDEDPRISYVESELGDLTDHVVIATDYMKGYAEQLRRYIPSSLHVLGTDGFGRSDSRESLRNFFEVDRYFIVVSALKGLADRDEIDKSIVKSALQEFSIDPEKANPLYA